jgi:hypothetical protein
MRLLRRDYFVKAPVAADARVSTFTSPTRAAAHSPPTRERTTIQVVMMSRRIIGSSGFDDLFLTNYIRFIDIKPRFDLPANGACRYDLCVNATGASPTLAREMPHRYTASNQRRPGYQG